MTVGSVSRWMIPKAKLLCLYPKLNAEIQF